MYSTLGSNMWYVWIVVGHILGLGDFNQYSIDFKTNNNRNKLDNISKEVISNSSKDKLDDDLTILTIGR